MANPTFECIRGFNIEHKMIFKKTLKKVSLICETPVKDVHFSWVLQMKLPGENLSLSKFTLMEMSSKYQKDLKS